MNIAPTLLGTGGHDAGANGGQSYSGYRYSNVCLGRSAMFGTNGFTDETFVQQTIHVPGTISYLSWGLDTAFGAALTLTLKKNSSNTALAVSVGGSTTGWVTDSTDHVTVADGNTLDFVAYAGNV